MKHSLLSVTLGVALMGTAGMAFADDAAKIEQGKTLFMTGAVPSCVICHTMQDAGAAGTIGPDLDELKPSTEQVVKAMQTGIGAMPSFAAMLSSEQIDAVAAYVVHATGGAK